MPGFQKFYRSAHPLALEQSLIAQIETEKNHSPIARIFVLVPNHYVGAHVQHELAVKKAHINIIFETIEGFATRLLSSNPDFLKKKRLTSEMELFWIGKTAEQHLKNTELENISGKSGFHKNLRSFFHHLISHQSTSIPNINSKTKFFDLLFSKYLKFKDHYHHGLWNIELASQTALHIDAPVLVYGFSEFSKLEQNFLTQLAKHANVQLWMEVFSSEKFQESTFTWLDQVFQNVEDLETIETTSTLTVQPLYHLEDEGNWIAQTILGAMRRKFGFDVDIAGGLEDRQDLEKRCVSPDKTTERVPGQNGFNRIGIFLNDYPNQEPYIRKALAQQSIPFVSIRGQALSETRFGLAFKSLLELLLTNWNRAEWFQFLQSFPFDPSIYEKNGSPTQWNHISAQARISSRDLFFMERLERYVDQNKSSANLSFLEFQKKILTEFSTMENAIKQNDFSNLTFLINKFFQDHAAVSEITSTVLLFLDELSYICSQITKSNWSEVQNLILEKLEQTFFTEKVFESDGVLIAPISMMKSLFFDVIFLPYLNEGKFPKNAERPFDLHPDEIKQISSKSPIRFSQVMDQFDEQSSWFDSAKDHCTQSLYISYSMYSLPKEEDLKPSILLHGFKKEPILVLQTTREYNDSPPPREKIRAWVESSQSETWSEYDAFLNPAYVSKEIHSASDFSKYAVCPKKYFLSSVLGLSEKDYLEAKFQMMPKDKGNLVHDILFRFFTQLKQKGFIPLQKEKRTQMQEMLTAIAKERFTYAKTFGSYGIENLWGIDENELLSNLMEYLDREIQEGSYWIPYSFEHRFGMRKFEGEEDDEHSSEKPLSLQLFQKKLLFKGKVDRIDTSADKTRLRITDYKTGQLDDRKSWGYQKGTQLQIPLYVLLADQFFPNDQLQEVNGKLVSIQAISKFDERTTTRTEILTKQEEIFSHLEMIEQGIASGSFFPNPGNGGENCTYCDFKRVCGRSIVEIREEKEETPFMITYDESKKALP